MSDYEFVDKKRQVKRKFKSFRQEGGAGSLEQLKTKLSEFITEDPDFLEPYLVLEEIYQQEENPEKAAQIRQEAFDRAVSLITDKEGNWPDLLPWSYDENRHIIRTLLQQAISEWENREWQQALDLLRLLIITNPNDNVAARYYILAIRMGFTFSGFEDRFNKGGYYDQELSDWFDEHVHRFTDEFDWWLKWKKNHQKNS